MPVTPSGMHTSAGVCDEMVGIGRDGHAGATDGCAAATRKKVARAATPRAPPAVQNRAVTLGRDYNPRMIVLSRREFAGVLVAGVSCAGVGAMARGTRRVILGVSTSSFRDLPRVTGRGNLDDVIRALQAVGATHVELAFANVEPAPPSTAPFMGGTLAYPQRIVLTPEQIAATNAAARASLRAWRSRTPLTFFTAVRHTLSAAGLTVHACAFNYDDSFTDDEVDATFRQAHALGAPTVSSSLTMATARRLVPFAERHRMSVAIHNQVDGNATGAISTPHLEQALALSPAFTLKLDIGNLTASNCDAVAKLRECQSRVSYVLVKDRLRNGRASQPFGEGDTPIHGVMDVLEKSASAIPAVVEYDYVGLRSSVEELKTALGYVMQR
jgi:sugar phosphate isomerase/epimerase